MTRNRTSRGRQVSVVLGSLLALALLAGCVANDDDAGLASPADDGDMADSETGATDTNGTGDENGDGAGNGDAPMDDEPGCTLRISELYAWSHDGLAVPDPTGADPDGDPLLLLGVSGSEEFTVAEGTTALLIAALAGDHVTLGFSVSVFDPTDSDRFTFEGAAGAAIGAVTGEEPEITETIVSDPAPGTWTVAWSVTGYVEGLNLGIDAERCL